MNKKKLIEGIKSLVIALLTLSALIMIFKTNYFGVLPERTKRGSDSEHYTQSMQAMSGAGINCVQTEGIAVLLGNDEKYIAIYDEEQLDDCYRKFSAIFGEAIGSAVMQQETDGERWRAALTEKGVLISYRSAQYADAIASGLGTVVSEELSGLKGNVFMLSAGQDENATLYIANEQSGRYYACTTAVSSQSLLNITSEFQTNDGRFAYEISELEKVSPYTLIPAQVSQIKSIKSANPIEYLQDSTAIYRLFGFNSGALHEYTESDGTRVFVESGKSMRISPEGRITFSGAESGGAGIEIIEAIAHAYAVVEPIQTDMGSEAEFVLSRTEKTSYGYLIEFEYSVNGITILLQGNEPAARFAVNSEGIGDAVLNLRTFSNAEGNESILPVKQVCALMTQSGASEIEIVYRENANEVKAMWVVGKSQ